MKIRQRFDKLKKEYRSIQKSLEGMDVKYDWHELLLSLDNPTDAYYAIGNMKIYTECYSELKEFERDVRLLNDGISAMERYIVTLSMYVWELQTGHSMPQDMDIEQIEHMLKKLRSELI